MAKQNTAAKQRTAQELLEIRLKGLPLTQEEKRLRGVEAMTRIAAAKESDPVRQALYVAQSEAAKHTKRVSQLRRLLDQEA